MSRESVRAYYASFGEREWTRLTTAEGAIEFAVTCHALTTFLPPSGRVLDIGGGLGRYTLWLAQRGYRVVLADLAPELLAIAQAQLEAIGLGSSVEEIVVADACDLSRWADGTFDAVLSFGPFSHLPDPGNRRRAATEMRRVLRPGGIAAVAVMPRYAFLRRTLASPAERHQLSQSDFVAQVLEEGIFLNDQPGKFTEGYGVRLAEVRPFFEGYGFTSLAVLACEGIAVGIEETVVELAVSDPVAYQIALDLVIQTASDPSLLGLSSHLLYIGQKRGVRITVTP